MLLFRGLNQETQRVLRLIQRVLFINQQEWAVEIEPNYSLVSASSRVFGDPEDNRPLFDCASGSISVLRLEKDGALLNNPTINAARAYVGDLRWTATSATVDHDGWLVCDGRSLYANVYVDLYGVIGNTYGTDGAGSFYLPNPAGRVLAVSGNGSGLTSRSPGDKVGSETHTLTIPEMPAHNHNATVSSDGSHSHTYTDAYFAEHADSGGSVFGTSSGTDYDNNFKYRTASGGYSSSPSDISTSTAAAHTHTVTLSSNGGGNAHTIMQPTLVIGDLLIFSGLLPADAVDNLDPDE
jgi:microcystin-dependent protein